jgi:hypothetical protein
VLARDFLQNIAVFAGDLMMMMIVIIIMSMG